jgi:hypothetical protein
MTQTTFTIKEPKAPATAPQISFLESLIKDRDCPTVAERYAFAKGFLTKGAASDLITEAKAAPKKPYQTTQPASVAEWAKIDQQVAEHDAALEAAKQALAGMPAFGYYNIDGTIYYWDITGKDAKPTLRKLSKVQTYNYSTGQYVTKGKWTKIFGTSNVGGVKAQSVTASYVPYAGKGWKTTEVTTSVWVPGVLAGAVLAGAQPLSEAETAKLGKQFGFCIRCGATLTDPVSVANGIGPVCAKYWA